LAAVSNGAPDPRRDALNQFIVSMKALKMSSLNARDHTIDLSDGTVAYVDLADRVSDCRFATQPVFLLDMCESAQLFPGHSENFVALFLKLKASAVVGTECEISPALGQAFADVFIDAMLLRGRSVGEALLDARQALAARRNPLGLVYTLYGQATRSLVPRAGLGEK
jgi:hypothetical protein